METQFLRGRWRDPAFLAGVQPLLDRIRRQKSLRGPADLRGMIVGATGAPSLLVHEAFANVKIEQVDLSSSEFSCAFAGATFLRVTLSDTAFDNCHFAKARFRGCDLSRCHLRNPWLEDGEFDQCDFRGATIGGPSGVGAHEAGRRIKFSGCDFADATFAGIKIAGADFLDCSFARTRFQECFVFNWRFQGSSPSPDQFVRCEYRGLNTGLNTN